MNLTKFEKADIEQIVREYIACCCSNVFSRTTLSPPVAAPGENDPHVLYNEDTGEIFGWTGSGWIVLNSSSSVIGITALSPPVVAPTGDDPTILVNTTTGVGYYWDSNSWEIAFTAVPNQAQIKTIEVDISSAQMLTMNVTPVVVIPGEVGKIHSVLKTVTSYRHGGIVYGGSANLTLRDATLNNNITPSLMSSTQFGSAADAVASSPQIATSTPLQTKGAAVIASLSGAITNGNGTLKLFITYQTITV